LFLILPLQSIAKNCFTGLYWPYCNGNSLRSNNY
jgi:hypothetical protein